MTMKPKYYFNLDGNITDGEKEYSLYNIEDRIEGLSVNSNLKERYVLYGRNSLLDLLNTLNDENEQLKKCNKQLAKRSIALDGICNPNCQMARKETVGHGDIRWICIINKSGDSTCYFGEVCKFLEGLEPIEDITDCVW